MVRETSRRPGSHPRTWPADPWREGRRPDTDWQARDTGVPGAVRCRCEPDGIVVWVPVEDEPEDAGAR